MKRQLEEDYVKNKNKNKKGKSKFISAIKSFFVEKVVKPVDFFFLGAFGILLFIIFETYLSVAINDNINIQQGIFLIFLSSYSYFCVKALVKWKREKKILSIAPLIHVLAGIFVGAHIALISMFAPEAIDSLGAFERYPKLKKAINYAEYDENGSVLNTQYFDASGQLLEDKKDQWCSNANSVLDGMSLSLHGSSFSSNNLEAILINGTYLTLFSNGCLTEQALLDKQNLILDNLSTPLYLTFMEKMPSPLSYNIAFANYSMNSRLHLSEHKVCHLYSNASNADINDVVEFCSKYDKLNKSLIDYIPLAKDTSINKVKRKTIKLFTGVDPESIRVAKGGYERLTVDDMLEIKKDVQENLLKK